MSTSAMTVTGEQRDPLAFIENPSPDALQAALAEGNLGKLTAPQRLQFLSAVCQSVGLNPLTSPFEFMSFQGKVRLYAKRDAGDQLRQIHQVSITIIGRERVGEIFTVTCRAAMPNGRTDESIGAVSLKYWQEGKNGENGRFVEASGEALANLLMKAETKAKRRVTLSICGLGLLDESELEDMRTAEETEQRQAKYGGNMEPPKPNAEGMTTMEATIVETPRHWSDLLIESAYNLVTFPAGTEWEGKPLWEVAKERGFEKAFKDIPREDTHIRHALDARYFNNLKTRWTKKGYDEDEVTAALRKSEFLPPDGDLRAVPGERLMDLGTAINDLPDLK